MNEVKKIENEEFDLEKKIERDKPLVKMSVGLIYASPVVSLASSIERFMAGDNEQGTIYAVATAALTGLAFGIRKLYKSLYPK